MAKTKAERYAEIKAQHVERMAEEGRVFACARCGTADKALEVFPRVGTGLTLAVALRQRRYELVRRILINRVLLCPECLHYELTGAWRDEQAVINPEPYVLRGV